MATVTVSPATVTWVAVTILSGTPPGGLKWDAEDVGKTHWDEQDNKPLHWDAKDL